MSLHEGPSLSLSWVSILMHPGRGILKKIHMPNSGASEIENKAQAQSIEHSVVIQSQPALNIWSLYF